MNRRSPLLAAALLLGAAILSPCVPAVGAQQPAGPTKQMSIADLRAWKSIRGPSASPDGKWLAYDSDESGRLEVYVRPFPGPGGRWQISTAGGSQPHWRRDGKELVYLTSENKLMAVPIATSPGFRAGPPALLFAVHPSLNGSAYDATGDHVRFLVNTVPDEGGSPPLSLLVHWTRLLAKQEESHR